MIYNLRDFLQLLDAAYKRRPIRLTLKEFRTIRALSNSSPLFSEQVQRYLAGDSKPYARLSERAMAQERARPQVRDPQGMGNVHDPLLKGPRMRTQEWLQEQDFVPQSSVGNLSEIYPAKQTELRVWIEESALKPEDKAVLEAYIPFFFTEYSKGATGAFNLFRAMAWANQIPQDQPDDRSEKKHNLLGGLLEAAKAYEGNPKKYYKKENLDYSCMPGLDERVLDVMTGVRLSLEPPVALEDESPQKRYIAASIDPFVTRDATGPKPTELFYALYLHAQYPQGFTISSQPAVQIQLYPNSSEQYTQALASYEQKIQADIALYQSTPSTTLQEKTTRAQLKLALNPYFRNIPESKEESETSNEFLGPDRFAEICSQQFESIYETYQNLILTGATLEEAQSQSIPSALQNIVESRSEYSYAAIVTLGLPLQESESLPQKMTILSGLEEDFLESLCRLSGGTEESLLGVFEAQIERGDRVSEALQTREGFRDQIQLVLQGIDTLYSQLSSTDRGHIASRSSFQNWFMNQIQSMNALNADFIGSEAQYLRVWDAITDIEVQKRLLLQAVEQDKTKFIQEILLKHPDWVSLRGTQRYGHPTLIHLATQRNHKNIVEILIKSGGSKLCELKDTKGMTALHWAAIKGYKDIANLLVQKGRMDLCKMQDDYPRKTALHYAVQIENKDIIELLIQEGGLDLCNIPDKDGDTALHYATKKGNTTIINILKNTFELLQEPSYNNNPSFKLGR